MKRIITITISLLLAAATFAQSVPQTVNFSATVRDADNELLANTPVNVRLTFYENGEGGTPVYCALHQTTTNDNGFMSFQLNRNVLACACNGAPNTTFEEIPWENGNYWMQVEYQTQIGGEFLNLGYLELTSGFYAFSSNYALVAQKLEDFDIDVEDAQDGDVLVYNGTTHKWEARRPDNIGGGGTTPNMPTVTTGTASDITAGCATLSGNVTSTGGFTVTARGFVYGTSENELSLTVTSGDGTGSYTAIIGNLAINTTYYYKAYATNAVGTAYGEVMSFATRDLSEATGYTNGYGYVDLGLPSGTKWATTNVGANNPEDYGNYYAWGETTTKETYNSSTYTYSDNPTTLPSSADAATANWGSGWRMPTQTEMHELIDNCTVNWTTQNGVNGRVFTGPNGNSIFLPAAGYRDDSELYSAGSSGSYGSSSLRSGGPSGVWGLSFDSYSYGMGGYGIRYCGRSVRPVCQP